MKIFPEKLSGILSKKVAGFYFCSGNDTFLVNELADKIISSAKQHGFNEVTRLYVDTGFSWEHVYTVIHSPSLFSPKILLVLQLFNWKLDEKAKTLLTESTQAHTDDLLVIVKGPKLERATSHTKWFQAMTEHAYWIELPLLSSSQVPEWLHRRAAQYGLQLSKEHAQYIAQRTENNLPAAAQALEKLQLLNLPITPTLIEEVIEVSAEYDAFKLIDACLAQDSVRAYHICLNLKNASIEPLMLIGAFARELRLIRELFYAQTENTPIKTAAQRLGIWESRLPLLQHFMRLHPLSECQLRLAQLASLDALAKGVTSGNIWNELLVFCMKIANQET